MSTMAKRKAAKKKAVKPKCPLCGKHPCECNQGRGFEFPNLVDNWCEDQIPTWLVVGFWVLTFATGVAVGWGIWA